MQRLTAFDLNDAHCYDPNEEARIRSVVGAVGETRFAKQISTLTQKLCDKIQERLTKRNDPPPPAAPAATPAPGSTPASMLDSFGTSGSFRKDTPLTAQIIGFGSLLNEPTFSKSNTKNALMASAHELAKAGRRASELVKAPVASGLIARAAGSGMGLVSSGSFGGGEEGRSPPFGGRRGSRSIFPVNEGKGGGGGRGMVNSTGALCADL